MLLGKTPPRLRIAGLDISSSISTWTTSSQVGPHPNRGQNRSGRGFPTGGDAGLSGAGTRVDLHMKRTTLPQSGESSLNVKVLITNTLNNPCSTIPSFLDLHCARRPGNCHAADRRLASNDLRVNILKRKPTSYITPGIRAKRQDPSRLFWTLNPSPRKREEGSGRACKSALFSLTERRHCQARIDCVLAARVVTPAVP